MSPDTYLAAPPAAEGDNYTMYDINIDEVDVTLSLWRWLDGKGLIKDASVKGVRGVIGELSGTNWKLQANQQIGDLYGGTPPSHYDQRISAMRPALEISSWIAYISKMRS
jgi:distribution and morphology protein 31